MNSKIAAELNDSDVLMVEGHGVVRWARRGWDWIGYLGGADDTRALVGASSDEQSIAEFFAFAKDLKGALGGKVVVKDSEAARGVLSAIQAKDPAVNVVWLQPGEPPFEAILDLDAKRLRATVSGGAAAQATDTSGRRTRVLIVDDSKTIREVLKKILGEDPQLEVVGAAELPSQVPEMIERLKPDVLTLDINMPEMDGATLLGKLLEKRFIPAVMISAISLEEGSLVMKALEVGAVDYIKKPSFSEIPVIAPIILEKVKIAAKVKAPRQASKAALAPVLTGRAREMNPNALIVIGASTGGTEAIREVLVSMPDKIPPVLIVQHIPPVFSDAFAQRLNHLCPFEVKEAKDGDLVQPNRVLIAPGGAHMVLNRAGTAVQIIDTPAVNRHKPSVDVLFDSVVPVVKKRNVVAAILTGMGADGAKGLVGLRKAGAKTIAQDEATCVVFGMPRAAIEMGGADEVLPLERVTEQIVKWTPVGKATLKAA